MDAGPPAELGGVVGGRVPEAPFAQELLPGEQLGIVNQDIGAVGELERRGVILATAVGSRSKHGGAMVGEVGDR